MAEDHGLGGDAVGGPQAGDPGAGSMPRPEGENAPTGADGGGRGQLLTANLAGRLLMISAERIRQLAKDGWIEKQGRDQFYLVDVVQGYIRFRNDAERRANKSAADNRVRAARAREIELRNEQVLGRLVPIESFQSFVDIICGTFRSELGGVPARVTRDLGLRRQVEKELYGVLERIADVVAEHIGRLEAVLAHHQTVADQNAGSVGGA